ncbi:MAG: hypothetical protein V5B34_04880 [Accumulibacter sp.]
MEFNFDLVNFLLGSLTGLILTSLLRLHALKELRLKLNKIGVDLGIEGFDAPAVPNPPSQSIGNVSGQGNEINQAGRDINKTSNLFKTVQAAAAAAIAKGEHQSGTSFQLQTRLSHYTQNPELSERLSQVQRSGDNWFEKYCSAYLQDSEFQRAVREEANRLRNQGWSVSTVRPVDNLNGGLLVEIISIKTADL